MAITAIVVGLVGAGVSAAGQVKAGNANKRAGAAAQDAAESQAELSEANAKLAEQQAEDATARGAVAENQFRTQVRGMIGSQRAGFAASGVDVAFGSALDVPADAARLGELDALTIRSNAAREAWGYKVTAWNDVQTAAIQRKEGANAKAAGNAAATGNYWGAGTSLLSGTSSLLMAKYGK
jgi:hypothetical protein